MVHIDWMVFGPFLLAVAACYSVAAITVAALGALDEFETDLEDILRFFKKK